MLSLRRFLSAAPLLAGAVLALLVPRTASADITGSFIPLGPDGGTIDALTVDPLDSLTVYAGAPDSGGGVFKSSDGGQTWEPVRNGMPLGASVLSLAVDPSRHTTVYAGTFGLGIYKSTDGGASWSQRNQGLITDNQFFALAVVPGSDTVLAGSERGVYRSLDGGATWAPANQGLPSPPAPEGPFVRALVASPSKAYATVSSNGVFKSLDGGRTWSAVNRGLPGGADVFALAISQQDGSLYAAVALHGVFRSVDGGAHWSAASGGLASSLGIHALAVDPGSPATVFAATDHGVFRSDDRGATWTAASTGLTSHDVLALAVPQSGILYAGTSSISPGQVSLGGVFQSSDGGRTWQRRSQGISTLFVTSLAAEPTTPTTLWVITTVGLFRSGDGGSSWSQVDPGLSGSLLSVVADPDRPGTVYVVGSSANSSSSLLVTHDSGATWQTLPVPGNASFSNVALDPRTHSLFLTGSGVYRSVDGGQTWTAAAGEIAGDFINQVTPDLSTPGVLYAAGRTPPGPHFLPPSQARVFKSTDGGVTWLRSDAGLETVTNLNKILVLPNAPATLYALGDFSIFRSRDAGATWELATQALPSPPQDLVATADGTLFAATQGAGVLTSTDGQTWVPIDGVPTQFNATTLSFDPRNPRRLYVGSGDFGLVAIAIATPSVCPSGATSATALCLQGRRFQMEVAWSDFNGNTGAGQTLPGNDQTGSFWFFDPNNTELAVKVLDGRALNNHFWVFYASLTNVAYTLTVTDTATGAVRVYKNPLGHFGSAGDTEAF
jgi:photosystem II stability/assembly factor-like uncharacterized protein